MIERAFFLIIRFIVNVGEFAGGALGVGEFDGVDAGGVGRAEGRPFVLLWHDIVIGRRAHLLKESVVAQHLKKRTSELPR